MSYLFQSTRLYIKECPHCGLRYFGKTISHNIEEYKGSGSRWLFHLEFHCVQPIHVWHSDWFYTSGEVKDFALKFSTDNNIVESTDWANLKPENGLDGGDNSEFIDYSDYSERSSIREKKKSKNGTHAWQLMDRSVIDYTERTKKSLETKNSTQENGLTIAQNAGKKTSETVTITVLENGLTIAQNRALDASKKIDYADVIRKRSATISVPEWQETVGKLSRINAVKNTDYVQTGSKQKTTKNTDEWQSNNSWGCEYCGKMGHSLTNYVRYHGEKCKKAKKTL